MAMTKKILVLADKTNLFSDTSLNWIRIKTFGHYFTKEKKLSKVGKCHDSFNFFT